MYRSIRGKKNQYGAKPNGLNDRDDSRWITPHLIELHGHWDPHCFKFVCNKDDECIMFYRNWTSDPWCPEDNAAVVLKVPV